MPERLNNAAMGHPCYLRPLAPPHTGCYWRSGPLRLSSVIDRHLSPCQPASVWNHSYWIGITVTHLVDQICVGLWVLDDVIVSEEQLDLVDDLKRKIRVFGMNVKNILEDAVVRARMSEFNR